MKKSQQVLCILALLTLLAISLILNFLQGDRIEELTKDVIELRQEQSSIEDLIIKYHDYSEPEEEEVCNE